MEAASIMNQNNVRLSFILKRIEQCPALLSIIFLFGLVPITCGYADESNIEKLNGGYFLLYQLSDDESQLPMLFMIKSAPSEITHFADRISKVAKESKALLENFHEESHFIRFDKNPLPAAEKEARKSISSEKEHQLLFGTSGPEFQKAVLVTQIEASGYGANLAKILSEDETNPERSRKLMEVSKKWAALQEEAYHLLDK